MLYYYYYYYKYTYCLIGTTESITALSLILSLVYSLELLSVKDASCFRERAFCYRTDVVVFE